MKASTPIFKILSIVLLAAVVVYFVVQGYRYVTDPINTTLVYASVEEVTVDINGYLVRDEETFHSDAGTLSHTLFEGERVGRNQVMATAYPDSGALTRVERLETLELRLEQLSFSLISYLDPDANVGKLIYGNTWYYAANITDQQAEQLSGRSTVTLRFAKGLTMDLKMTVVSISRSENGHRTLLLSSDKYIAQTTLLRQQTAELIFNSWSGLRIPKQALRMEKSTYTDKETGQEVQNNRLGVYALLGGRAEFKTVEVVTEGDDYYVVRSTTDESDALRAGDEVIVRATELYDGQLLEY